MERMKLRAAVCTLGCRTNQYESDAAMQELKALGCEICPYSEKADIYIVNTCSVTAEADKKSRQMLHRAKKENPEAIVVAVGCFSQLSPSEAEKSGADIVCGNRNKLEAVRAAVKMACDGKKESYISICDVSEAPMEKMNAVSAENTRAYLKICDGCDNNCSYCIIRKARGTVVSRPADEIREEAEKIAAGGYKEIILTGTEMASYGKDIGAVTLADAVDAASSPDGIKRVRIGSVEPSVIRDELLIRLASNKKFLPSFHLSLQSGSSEVLKRMRRKYNSAQALASVEKIKKYMPDAGFSADIIVGFPGETEEDFEETVRLCRLIGLYHIHIFPYSDRKGTEASAMEGKLSPEIKSRRLASLAEEGGKIRDAFYASLIKRGAETEVLFEERHGDICTGHAAFGAEAYMKTNKELCNTIIKCKITGTDGDRLIVTCPEL